jgi:hypothetical protein
MIPQLEYRNKGKNMEIRWTNTVPGFKMPVRLTNGDWITPTANWSKISYKGKDFAVDKNFYIAVKEAK